MFTQFRVSNNKLEQSVDLGLTWTVASDYIAAWFRFTGTTGSSQADNVGKIQISRDNGATWSDLSGEFTNSLHIKGYVATVGALPSTAVQGDIYGVGPTYDTSDTEQTNPIYQLYVKDSTGWVNNGKFTSIAAGVVQTTGTSTTEVMSQDAVSKEFASVRSDLNENKSKIGDKNDEYGVTTTDIRSDLLNGTEDEGNKGWRIERTGSPQNLGPSSGYYKTNPYQLLSGDKITLVTNSGTTDTAVIATVKDGLYSTKVVGVGYEVTTYEYTALEDCYIVVSFYKNFTSAILERGKTIVGILDEIRPQTGRVVYASEFGMDDQHDCADALEAAMNRMKNKGILVIDRDITVGRQVNVEGLFYCKIIGSQPGTRITGTFSANTNTDPSILNLKCNGVSFENLHISYNVVSTTYKTRLVKIVPMTDGQSDLDVTFTNCTFEAFPSVPMSGVIAITAIGRGLKLDNCALLGQSNNGEPFIHITPRWNNLTTPFQDKPDNCRAVIITNCRIHNGSRGPIIYLNQDPYEPQVGFWGVVISNNYVDSVNFIVESNAKIRDLQITNNIFLEPDSFPLDGTLGGLVILRDIDGLLISGNVFAALKSYSISSVYSILLSPQSGFSVFKNIVITNNIFDGERNNCLIRCTNEVVGMGVVGLIISNNTFKDKCFGTSEDNHEGIINWSNCNWLNVAIIGNSYQGSSIVPAIKGVTTPGGNSWRCENIAIKGNVNIVNNIDYTQGENLTVINLDN